VNTGSPLDTERTVKQTTSEQSPSR